MFEVTTKAGKTYEVEAETIEGAARHHAKTACGSRAVAKRTTGTLGLSGWFQAYAPCRGSGTSNYASAGEPFHVWEPPATR
jgi:hypothetical protein